jgi:hypothetical protein
MADQNKSQSSESVVPPGLPAWFTPTDYDPVLKRVRGKALLSKFKSDDVGIHGIRDGTSYESDDVELKDLAKSINFNGVLRIDTDIKVVYMTGATHLTVVGGQRRIAAANLNLQLGAIKDQEIHCIIIEPEEKNQVAARDNAYRKGLNDMEQYRQIVMLDKTGMTSDAIGASVGMGKDTVDRYLAISNYKFLEAMLEDKMPYTRLSKIATSLKEKSLEVKSGTKAFFEHWHKVEVPERRKKRKAEAAKENKTIKDTSLEISKMLKTGEYEGWIRDINEGNVPTGKPKIAVVTAETRNDTLKVSGLSLDLTKYTWPEIAKVFAKYQDHVLPEIKKAMNIAKFKATMEESADRDEAYNKTLQDLGVDDTEGDSEDTDADPMSSTANDPSDDEQPGFDDDAD